MPGSDGMRHPVPQRQRQLPPKKRQHKTHGPKLWVVLTVLRHASVPVRSEDLFRKSRIRLKKSHRRYMHYCLDNGLIARLPGLLEKPRGWPERRWQRYDGNRHAMRNGRMVWYVATDKGRRLLEMFPKTDGGNMLHEYDGEEGYKW